MILNFKKYKEILPHKGRQWFLREIVLQRLETYNYPQGRVTDHRIQQVIIQILMLL